MLDRLINISKYQYISINSNSIRFSFTSYDTDQKEAGVYRFDVYFTILQASCVSSYYVGFLLLGKRKITKLSDFSWDQIAMVRRSRSLKAASK